jgi:23S rRNA (guanine745-N1)-methyltransferase
LGLVSTERRWVCRAEHSFDVASEGYVNLLISRRKGRDPGDSAEMVTARRRFLGSGAYDPISAAVSAAVAEAAPNVVLDVGCGEGRHTRHLHAGAVLGADVSKPAVAAAARAHPAGWYAVASASDLPLPEGSVDFAVNIFGPVFAAELARVVRPGGLAVTVHPGPGHLAALRALVYEEFRPHEVKAPLRGAGAWFDEVASLPLQFPVVVADLDSLRDLFAMTPYRWHGPRDMDERLAAAAGPSFATMADVRVTTYRRQARTPEQDQR